MPSKFEWKTGEDSFWEDEQPVKVAPAIPPRLKKTAVMAAAGLLMLVVMGLLWTYLRVESQVASVAATLEEDVLVANRLLLETVLAGDNDLVSSLIAQQPQAWHDTQMLLVRRGLFVNRAPLNIWLDVEAEDFPEAAGRQAVVTLAPNLQTAEVVMPLPQLALDEEEELQELTLTYTAVFEQQDGYWLLAEPSEQFWGRYQQLPRERLTLIVPERDEAIGERLADDLNALLEEICEDREVECPLDFVFEIRLEREVKTLLGFKPYSQLHTNYVGGQRTTRLTFPTPTLVGLPIDEAGYEALSQGYKAQFALALMNTFYEDNWSLAPNRTPPVLREKLREWGLNVPFPAGYHPVAFVQPPPLPLPVEDIAVLCQTGDGPWLFQYDLTQSSWQTISLMTEGVFNFYGGVTHFPNGEGILMQLSPRLSDDRTTIVWVRGDEERTILSSDESYFILEPVLLAEGQYLLTLITSLGEESEYSSWILDESNCTSTSCDLQPFGQWLTASPDGRYTLLTQPDSEVGFVYALGDRGGTPLHTLGQLHSFFWLDEHTLGFVRTADSGSRVFYTAVLAEDGEIRIEEQLSEAALQALIDEAGVPGEIVVGGVLPYPLEEPETLVVYGVMPNSSNPPLGMFFQYDWQTEQLAFLPELNDDPFGLWVGVEFSPDGRFMMVYGVTDFAMKVYDLAEKELVPLSFDQSRLIRGRFAWSPDSQWLLLLGGDVLQLIAPAYRYETLIYPTLGMNFCETAAWVNWQ